MVAYALLDSHLPTSPALMISRTSRPFPPVLLVALALACVALAFGGCDTEETEEATLAVRWIEVAASNYQLRLEPEFDAGTLSYLAHADGPDIEVYVDVLLTGDVEVVRINGEDATLVGFRSWRSPPAAALISPTSVEVEIVDARLDAPLIYSIDVVLPL